MGKKIKFITVCDIFNNPPVFDIKFGAGAAKSRITLVVPQPVPWIIKNVTKL
jgi:hypothetical protein